MTKYIKLIIIMLLLSVLMMTAVGCDVTPKEQDFVRIHIRANSNSENDQSIKLLVRDEIIGYLTPILSKAQNQSEAKNLIQTGLSEIIKISDKVLYEHGFDYTADADMRREEFPTRSYGELVLPGGDYDAVVIELGSGKGDNWWCIAFPPLCFIPDNGENVIYKSLILEIIEKVLDKKQK